MTDFLITTADTLPATLGGSREVKRMRVIKFTGYSHPTDAQERLVARAQELGFDAVIGVRFLVYAEENSREHAAGSAANNKKTRWAIYGTAIGW